MTLLYVTSDVWKPEWQQFIVRDGGRAQRLVSELVRRAKRSRPLLVKLGHVGHTGAQSHDLRVLAERRSARARPRTVSVITPENEPAITVDDIEVAQFIYLMLNYQKVRNVLQTFRNSRASNSTVLKPQVDAVWTRCAVPPRPSGSRSGL
jgi:hypothetical protein